MKSVFTSTTILVGAGLSRLSGLPDANALAARAFDMVVHSGPIFVDKAELVRLRRAAKQLRLEILLERFAAEVPKEFLFSVYDSLLGAKPNFNHLAVIALKPRSIVTTNQDLLLEAAAKLLRVQYPVVHLHGRCDNKQSIITTISQYLDGLGPTMTSRFRESLKEADVVVLGYSGRDRDIMPLLGEGTMKSITWLNHPGSQRSPELLRLKEQLLGRITIIDKDANGWLKEKLPKALLSELKSIEDEISVPSKGRHKIPPLRSEQLTPYDANLAIGRVLEHVGKKYNVAFKLYRRLLKHLRTVGASLEKKTRVQLAIGRVQTFQYHFKRAYNLYISIAHNNAVPITQRCQALSDCVFALRNSSNYKAAYHILDELEALLSIAPPTITIQKLRGEAASSRAGMLRLDGNARESVKLYQRADKHFRKSHDVDGWIEVSTWLADNLLTLGQFRDVDIYLKRAIDDADAYGRYYGKTWASFLHGELLGLRGDIASGLESIKRAYELFRQIDNPQGQVYSLLYISDFAREESLTEAGHALKHADKLLQKYKFAYAEGRYLLEKAELARARGRSLDVQSYLTVLNRHLKNKYRFISPPPLLLAHSRCVAAEHARETDRPNALILLQKARDMYFDLEANYYVTRIDVARWLITCARTDRSQLMKICKREGYGHEIRRLRNPTTKYYPLHFV